MKPAKKVWAKATNGAYKEPGHSLQARLLSPMPTSITLPTSHHFHPSSSPVVSLSLGFLVKPAKKVWADRDAVWSVDSTGPN